MRTGIFFCIFKVVNGKAAARIPAVGISKAGFLPASHAPAHTPTPMASLLTDTHWKESSFIAVRWTSAQSESGRIEMKFIPACFSPLILASTASLFIDRGYSVSYSKIYVLSDATLLRPLACK